MRCTRVKYLLLYCLRFQQKSILILLPRSIGLFFLFESHVAVENDYQSIIVDKIHQFIGIYYRNKSIVRGVYWGYLFVLFTQTKQQFRPAIIQVLSHYLCGAATTSRHGVKVFLGKIIRKDPAQIVTLLEVAGIPSRECQNAKNCLRG